MARAAQADSEKRWAVIRDAEKLPAFQIELLKDFLQEFPTHAAGWWFLGTNLSELSRFDEAEPAFHKYIELAPSKFLHYAYCAMGELYRHKGDDKAAEQWFRKAIGDSPDDAQGYIYLGAMLARRGRLHEVEQLHRRATTC